MTLNNRTKAESAAQPKRDARSRGVQQMFNGIARRYDLMNSLMTFGRDRSWRRFVARRADLPARGRLLDIGTGTGGIAMEAVKIKSSTAVVAADFSFDMMQAGRQCRQAEKIEWCTADALHLPFADNAFDAVTSGYLIRNVNDAEMAFREQLRVIRPGGRVVCLDTSPPKKNLLYPMVLCHMKWVIPLLGGLISGNSKAYTYLPDSTRAFQTPRELSETMERAGLVNVSHRSFMFDTIAVHVGTCP